MAHGIAIRVEGKGRRVDNVFVERLWRSVKYEEGYRKAYESLTEERQALASYFVLHNTRRLHRSLDDRTPGSCTSQRTK